MKQIIGVYCILILLFLINICIVVSQTPLPTPPPKCITIENVYQGDAMKKFSNTPIIKKEVEWWYLQQLKNIEGGAIYTDSDLSKNSIISEIDDYYTKNNLIPNPVTKTFEQSLDTNYFSIAYNNEPSKNVNDDPTTRGDPGFGAHAKGFFIWNENGGIHVIHSYPESPVQDKPADDFFVKGATKIFGQHSFCNSLTRDELDIIPKLMIYGDFIINSINGVSIRSKTNKLSSLYGSIDGIKQLFQVNMVDFIDDSKFEDINGDPISLDNYPKTFNYFNTHVFKNLLFAPNGHWSKNKIELKKWSIIASQVNEHCMTSSAKVGEDCVHYDMVFENTDENSKYFIQTSHSDIHDNKKDYDLTRRGFNMIWDFIANHYSGGIINANKWFINTMQRAGKVGNDKMSFPPDSINIVRRTEAPWSNSKYTSDGIEHSKIAYSLGTIPSDNVFCIGDLNWQGKQESRGGCAFCSKQLGYVAEYYERRVGVIAEPPPKKDYVTFGNEVIPYSLAGIRIDFTAIIDNLKTGGYLSERRPLMEFIKFDPNHDLYYYFNPRVFIDTVTLKKKIVYAKNGAITDDNVDVKVFNSDPKEIYIPVKLRQVLPPASSSIFFETSEDFTIFAYPGIENEIILCDQDYPDCNYGYTKHLVASDLKFTLEFKNYKGSDKTKAIKQLIISNPIVTPTYNPVASELKDQVELVDNIKKIYKYFQVTRGTATKFVKVDDITRYNLIQDPYECFASDEFELINYQEGCYDYLVYCISELFATVNRGDYGTRTFNEATHIIMNAIWNSGAPDTCFIPPNEANTMNDLENQAQPINTMNDSDGSYE